MDGVIPTFSLLTAKETMSLALINTYTGWVLNDQTRFESKRVDGISSGVNWEYSWTNFIPEFSPEVDRKRFVLLDLELLLYLYHYQIWFRTLLKDFFIGIMTGNRQEMIHFNWFRAFIVYLSLINKVLWCMMR